jgi:iron(III) transport system substrate-binding protein
MAGDGRVSRRMALAVGLCLVVVSCAPAPVATPAQPTAATKAAAQSDAAQWEKETYEAAKKEGKVVVYGFWNPDSEKMARDFMAEFYPGVELETLTTTTAPEKIRTERQTGQYLVDVYLGGQTTPLTLAEMGVTEEFKPPAETAPDAKWVVPPSSYTSYPQVIYGLQGKGVFINTQAVPPDKEPRNWKDLLDPFWKGKKIVLDHPGRGGGPGPSWARWMMDQPGIGREYLEALKAQEVVLAAGSAAPQINSVARGEYFAYIPAYPSALAQVKGAPVKFIWPEPGTGGGTTSLVALMKDAPHPSAARLFINMQLLAEYQKRVSETLWVSPNRAAVAVPDPIISLDGRKVAVDTEAEIRRTTDWANTVGRQIFGE